MTDTADTLREIRKQLRLSMNGVVSTSMREKGATYKLNFGVSLPKIKEIAARYPQDATLAEILWKEDVRELKILATLLQPAALFTREEAEEWASAVDQQEIAELFTAHLLQHLSYARSMAFEWIDREEEFRQVMGYLILARLCMRGETIDTLEATRLIGHARTVMDHGISRTQRAALLALKRYGRQSPVQAMAVLSALSSYPESGSEEKKEFYEDLKFEFDYYQ